jgi:hypothetical protein
MKCPHCEAENAGDRKFCGSCGDPMGVQCDRCGTVNESHDKYCGSCGFALVHSSKTEKNAELLEGEQESLGVKQYSEREIIELMSLRKKMKKEEDSSVSLRQDDINKLFS